MKSIITLHKKILYVIFFTGLLLASSNQLFSQDFSCSICPTIGNYIATPDRATYLIGKTGYTPPSYLKNEWKKFPTVRKLEMAYEAFEKKRRGNQFLSHLINHIRENDFGAIADEEKIKPFININFEDITNEEILEPLIDIDVKRKLKFKHPKIYQKVNLPKLVQKQILTINKYIDVGVFGGIKGTLQYELGLSEDITYKILRESNSFTDAFMKGINHLGNPPPPYVRIKNLVTNLIKKYPSAREEKMLTQFLKKYKKIRAKITDIVISELVAKEDIIAVFDPTNEIESITKTKKYQDFVELAPENRTNQLTVNTFKKVNASKQSAQNDLLKFLKDNIPISNSSINAKLYEPIESFISHKTDEIFNNSFINTEGQIKKDLKVCKEEFNQLFIQKTESKQKLKLLMTELANDRMKSISDKTFAEIDSYYKNVSNHLSTISENSRWETIRKTFRERINYTNLAFNNKQIAIFKTVLDDWDKYKNKNKFKWYNSNITSLEEQFYKYSKSSGKIKACWGFILQQQDWDGAVYYYTYVAPNSSARGNPYYLLNYYYNSTGKEGKIKKLYAKTTDYWVGKQCPPH
jgi:hypothetical protein